MRFAYLKAGVAYQQTPGFKDAEHVDSVNIVYRNQWIRSSGIPGSFPRPDSVDNSTQTDIEPAKQEESILQRAFSAAGSIMRYNSTSSIRHHLPRKDSTDSILSDASTVTSNNRKSVCCICTSSTLFSDENQEQIVAIEELKTPYSSGNLVHLNVGGIYYDTGLETLTSIPNSHLKRMFDSLEIQEAEFDEIEIGASSEFSFSEKVYRNYTIYTPPTSSDGRFFIDRDGLNPG